jgi:hypothetical protein
MKDEIGWSFVAMKDGEVVSERHEGFADRDRTKAWKAETMAPVWSATKGPMAVCVLMALHRAGMDGESMVERVWPELRVGSLTFEEMFSHQGGLAGLHEKCSIWDREAVVASLEKQERYGRWGRMGIIRARLVFWQMRWCGGLMGVAWGRFGGRRLGSRRKLIFGLGYRKRSMSGSLSWCRRGLGERVNQSHFMRLC